MKQLTFKFFLFFFFVSCLVTYTVTIIVSLKSSLSREKLFCNFYTHFQGDSLPPPTQDPAYILPWNWKPYRN